MLVLPMTGKHRSSGFELQSVRNALNLLIRGNERAEGFGGGGDTEFHRWDGAREDHLVMI